MYFNCWAAPILRPCWCSLPRPCTLSKFGMHLHFDSVGAGSFAVQLSSWAACTLRDRCCPLPWPCTKSDCAMHLHWEHFRQIALPDALPCQANLPVICLTRWRHASWLFKKQRWVHLEGLPVLAALALHILQLRLQVPALDLQSRLVLRPTCTVSLDPRPLNRAECSAVGREIDRVSCQALQPGPQSPSEAAVASVQPGGWIRGLWQCWCAQPAACSQTSHEASASPVESALASGSSPADLVETNLSILLLQQLGTMVTGDASLSPVCASTCATPSPFPRTRDHHPFSFACLGMPPSYAAL